MLLQRLVEPRTIHKTSGNIHSVGLVLDSNEHKQTETHHCFNCSYDDSEMGITIEMLVCLRIVRGCNIWRTEVEEQVNCHGHGGPWLVSELGL